MFTQMGQKILILFICVLFANCAPLILETRDNSTKQEDEIEIKVIHNQEFVDFTAFMLTIRNNQSKSIYFNPAKCKIESTFKKKTFVPLTYQKVIKRERWERESLPSYQKEKEWIEIPVPPDYYFGNVPLYDYEMDKIKPLLFEGSFIASGEEKSGYIFFPLFKEGDRLKLTVPIREIIFDFTYVVKSKKKSKFEQILEELFFLNN